MARALTSPNRSYFGSSRAVAVRNARLVARCVRRAGQRGCADAADGVVLVEPVRQPRDRVGAAL